MNVNQDDCFFAGKTYLLAGGTGFIGRRVAAFLADVGSNVYIISRGKHENKKNIQYIQADLNDRGSFAHYKSVKYDACIYMAANIPEVGQKKETYYDAKKSTLDPLVNFCDIFTEKCSSFIYISSIDVLGKTPGVEYGEEAVPGNATPYGLAKFCGEFYVKEYCNQGGIPWKSLRFSQVYGPGEPMVRIIPILRNALLNKKEFCFYSDGQEKRRFLYVDDAVKAICCALKSDTSGIFNIAGAEVCTMEQLVRTMEAVYDRKLDLKILNQTTGYDNVPSIKKAEVDLDYFPSVSIKEGLEKIHKEEEQNE